jgi:ribosome biogenesis GTPase
MTTLADWGWDDGWAAALASENALDTRWCARITGQERGRWTVQLESGPAVARAVHAAAGAARPVTGDWVLVAPGPTPHDPLTLMAVLPRRSAISRGAAGEGATEQVLAANVDRVWIVQGLDRPPNPRAVERYLAVAWQSGATPEVVLTKADLADDPASAAAALGEATVGAQVHLVSVQQPGSVDALRDRLGKGQTAVLLGPSGAGKSTLINALAGAALARTGDVRASDGKGRHTTTRRALFRIPGGALLIDTPGLRELRVWDLDEGLGRAFPEIDALAEACRFRDCRHETEPGCAVRKALEEGDLDASRLASYRKLRAEAAYTKRKADPAAHAAYVAEHKSALKTLKYHPKYRDR